MSDATTPKPGDLDTDLIRKIILLFSPLEPDKPRPGDNKTTLLRKWLNAVNT